MSESGSSVEIRSVQKIIHEITQQNSTTQNFGYLFDFFDFLCTFIIELEELIDSRQTIILHSLFLQ